MKGILSILKDVVDLLTFFIGDNICGRLRKKITDNHVKENENKAEDSLPDKPTEKNQKSVTNKITGILFMLSAIAGILVLLFGDNIFGKLWKKTSDNTLSPTPALSSAPTPIPTLVPTNTPIPTPSNTPIPIWTAWSLTPILKDNSSYIEEAKEDIAYVYRDKVTSTGSSDIKKGWLPDEPFETSSWSDYGTWSAWDTKEITESEEQQVETKSQYRYQDKQTASENSSTNAGWTLYDTTWEWGDWSDWTSDVLTTENNEEIETTTTTVTRYQYSNAYWFETSGHKTRKTGIALAESHGMKFSGIYVTANSSINDKYGPTVTGKFKEGVSGTSNGTYTKEISDLYDTPQEKNTSGQYLNYYWSEETVQIPVTMYRKRSKIYTYHFYKWGEWSIWSDTAVTDSDTRNVESRTVYRFRTRNNICTYHFYKWNDWSQPMDEKPTKKENREIEERVCTYYRYRKK